MKNFKLRPIAPHIWIYKWPITMVVSLMHRISGGILYFGTIFFIIWIVSISLGESSYNYISHFYTSSFMRIVFFFYTFFLIYHCVGGIRHIFWDFFPSLIQTKIAIKLAKITTYTSIILTIFIWIMFYRT